jgi:hypothetical protein
VVAKYYSTIRAYKETMADIFMEAVDRHLALVETLGEGHPDTMRAMLLAMELAPDEIKQQLNAKARELDLLPDAMGYLEDGAPMYSLDDIARKTGVSIEEAEETTLKELMAEREALGLSNEVMLADDKRIHRRQ